MFTYTSKQFPRKRDQAVSLEHTRGLFFSEM